jgi:heme a synthase
MPIQTTFSTGNIETGDNNLRYQTAVRVWLAVVAALIAAIVVVGGLTRLTDSGLSITEWQLISGTLPPLSDEAWQAAFAKYRQIPEYRLVNQGMDIAAFKSIYWWEWGHRFLGRFIGFVFFVPFVFFWVKKAITRPLAHRLVVIFILGGLQGALGWYMVKSGLVDRIDVSQYRLAAHLGLAVLLFGFVFWTLLRLGKPSSVATDHNPHTRTAVFIIILIFAQILLGALVAGTHAGRIYNTWPLMEGVWFPEGLLSKSPIILNFFENLLTVQFDHRMGAYLIVLVVLYQAYRVLRTRSQAGPVLSTGILMAVMVGQVLLGIWTLLAVVPIDLAVAHQAGALGLFAAAIYHLHTLKRAGSIQVPDPDQQ